MILFLIPIGLCKTQLFYFTPQFPTPYHELYCKAIGANDQKKILTIIIVDRSTKIRLVRAYFTSFYGREPWHITNNCIEYICTAWRRGIRQVWRLPNTTHSSLLPGLCKTIPLLDLFYKRMLKFVYRCLNSQSLIVNVIVRHSILFSRMNSTTGRNVLSGCQRYHTSIYNIIGCNFSIIATLTVLL